MASLQGKDLWPQLRVSFGDIDVVNARAVEAQIDAVLVRFVTEVATERFLAGVRTKMSLEVVGLGVPAAADGTLERLFPGVGTDVDDQALLVGERLAAGGADVRPVACVDSTVLRQHALGQEVGTTLALKGSVAGVLADVLRELRLLAERALARGARERLDAEVSHLVRRQLDLLHERLAARAARERPLPGVQLVVHPQRQRRREMLAADVAQERVIVGEALSAGREHDHARLCIARRAVRRLFQVVVEFAETRALLVARGTLHDGSGVLVDVPRHHVAVEIGATLERDSAQAAGVLVCTARMHLLMPNEALPPCKFSVARFTFMHHAATQTFNLSGNRRPAGSGGRRHYDELWVFFGHGHRNEHASRLLLDLYDIVVTLVVIVTGQVSQVVVGFDGGSRLVRIQLGVIGGFVIPVPLFVLLLARDVRSTQAGQ